VIQVALAFVLVVGAVLLMRSFLILTSVNPGFDYREVETGRIVLSETSYPEPDDRAVFIDRLLGRLRALPGMKAVSAAAMMPFGSQHNTGSLSAEGFEISAENLPPVANWFWVDGSYFSTMGIPFIDGRSFAPTDNLDANLVAVIDRALAVHFWPGENPIGRTIYDGLDGEDTDAYTVVGVVDSVKVSNLDDNESRGDIYFSIRQAPQDDFFLTYKSNLQEGSTTESVRSVVLDLDPEIPLMDVKSLKERIDDSLSGRRTPMILLQIFGGIALVLSAIGIYGILTYSVSQRRREIGIRMAIGARVRQIGFMVLRTGLRLVFSGLVVGVAGAYALTRFVENLLFGVGTVDAIAFFGSAFLLAVIGVLACYLPALRASRVDPLTLLREE
jgi:predicted permease